MWYDGYRPNSFEQWQIGYAKAVITSTAVGDEHVLPTGYVLEQNYPNPFNPSTTVRFGLPRRTRVTLVLFNALGQSIRTLLEGEQEAGYHEIRVDGSGLSSGVYFYRLQAGDLTQTRYMILVR